MSKLGRYHDGNQSMLANSMDFHHSHDFFAAVHASSFSSKLSPSQSYPPSSGIGLLHRRDLQNFTTPNLDVILTATEK